MDILDDMGVSKLSAKVFLQKWTNPLNEQYCAIYIFGKKLKTTMLFFYGNVDCTIFQ